jgi:hypothetical protein
VCRVIPWLIVHSFLTSEVVLIRSYSSRFVAGISVLGITRMSLVTSFV